MIVDRIPNYASISYPPNRARSTCFGIISLISYLPPQSVSSNFLETDRGAIF
eukprot:COSAG01_NODE_59697_length_299_cov_0.255000_1_plen_51_part_10